jgi:hypothetical protein
VNTKGDIDIRNIGLDPLFDGVQTNGIASLHEKAYEFRVGAIHDLHFGDHFCLDLLAFLENDKVSQAVHEFNTETPPGGGGGGGNIAAPPNVRDTDNRVRGFGPGVGLITRWYAPNPDWHVFAGLTTTILFADNQFNQTFIAAPSPFYIYAPEDSHSVVGKLDVNFGINYHHALKREMYGMQWDIALGMRYMNMFNALKNGNTAWTPNAAGGQFPANFAANLGSAQDWGRYGPFLKFKLGGAHS